MAQHSNTAQQVRHAAARPVAPVAIVLGGWQRLKVIVLLACVLGLDGADKATIGAIGSKLSQAFNIGHTEIGLLVTASTLVGAIATLPLGVLVDRIHRQRLLTAAIVIWSAAMLASGFADSYLSLLLTRLALGAIVATAAPAIASLTGDLFPAYERGRIWGYLLAGEFVGSAVGLLASGTVAGWVDWRAAFWLMGVLGMMLAVFTWFVLNEPERGGQARLPPNNLSQRRGNKDTEESESDDIEPIEHEINRWGYQPHEDRVLTEPPEDLTLWQAARHILSIRTNVILIIASALGYFYFTGLRAFAVAFISGRFDLSESTATLTTVAIGLGAIAGVLFAGRFADRLIRRGVLKARVTVGAAAFLLTAVCLVPGLLSPMLYITMPMFFLAAAALGATNPPLDAARLDIVHSRLWGRAESIRTTLRYLFEAAAPVSIGYLASILGPARHVDSTKHNAGSAIGLQHAFLVLVIMLVAGGLLLLLARRYYSRDVATALTSEHET